MTKLAKLIATEEGFFRAGTLPARNHNPGDLRHSLHSQHPGSDREAIGVIDNDADGWSDLERQLRLYAERGLTLAQAIHEFAPPNENDTDGYLAYVVHGLGLPAWTPVKEALAVQA